MATIPPPIPPDNSHTGVTQTFLDQATVTVNELLTLFTAKGVTAGQIVPVVGAIIGLGVSLGIITNPLAQLLTSVAVIVITAAFMVARAIMSHGHSQVHAAQIRAGVAAADTSKPGD